MSLSGEKWTRAKAVVLDALELPTGQRPAFVERECADDTEVLAEARALLEADATARTMSCLWEPKAAGPGIASPPEGAGSALVGRRIGRYVVVRMIGMGGMGAVYEARQEGLDRRVALKVMRAGLFSAAARSRFERESRLLARLEHPGIARIYDAGVHESELGSVPYFAMELVHDAVPITEHCRRAGLDIRERAALFAGVCDAVHYGHQRGVIHRDLKPSNILVGHAGPDSRDGTTSVDDSTTSAIVTKVIDLGVARSTDADVAIATLDTGRDGLVGTLAYMSPEQCLLDPADLDTRSDVYALGVVLYELLAGRLPYQVLDKPLPEAFRMIQQVSAERPSSIEPRLAGDLSVILLKALAKERGERYDSAAALADDLRRWLANEPIAARPASRMYQARMFARRNRALVYASSAVAMAVLAGLIATSLGLRRAVIERDRALSAETLAREEKARAENTSEFLTDLFRAMGTGVNTVNESDAENPIAASSKIRFFAESRRVSGRPRSMIEVFMLAREAVNSGVVIDARQATEIRLLLIELTTSGVGSGANSLGGVTPESMHEFRAGAAALGWTHPRVQSAGLAVVKPLRGLSKFAPVIDLLRTLFERSESELGPADPRTLELGRYLSQYLLDESVNKGESFASESSLLASRLIENATRAHGENSRLTLACRVHRAGLNAHVDPSAAAREAREVLVPLGPDVAPTDYLLLQATALSVVDIPLVPATLAGLERRVEVGQRVFDAARVASGNDGHTSYDNATLESIYVQLGRYDCAIQVMRTVVDDCLRTLGPRYQTTCKAQARLARLLLWSGGDVREALELATLAHTVGVTAFDERDDWNVFSLATMLDARRASGEPQAALEGIDELIRQYRSRPGNTTGHLSWLGFYVHAVAAQSLEQMGRLDEARDRWYESLAEMGPRSSFPSSARVSVLRIARRFFEAHGPPEEAERVRTELFMIGVEPASPRD
jgi:tRNA A-37 threonylcarbamoyl transferase component Bud32